MLYCWPKLCWRAASRIWRRLYSRKLHWMRDHSVRLLGSFSDNLSWRSWRSPMCTKVPRPHPTSLMKLMSNHHRNSLRSALKSSCHRFSPVGDTSKSSTLQASSSAKKTRALACSTSSSTKPHLFKCSAWKTASLRKSLRMFSREYCPSRMASTNGRISSLHSVLFRIGLFQHLSKLSRILRHSQSSRLLRSLQAGQSQIKKLIRLPETCSSEGSRSISTDCIS